MKNFLVLRAVLCCAMALLFACDKSSNTGGVTEVDLSFSDAAVNGASEVVITVDRITFRKASDGGDGVAQHSNDIVVESFKSTDGAPASDTFSLDLLTVQGEDRRLVIDAVELPVGDYSNLLIDVIDMDNLSYVTDESGSKPLKVPSGTLKLGGFTIEPTSKQSMVVEFGLQQSMTYNPGPDRYILKPRGVRIISVDKAALVKGGVDHASLQTNQNCESLETGGIAGSVYLYPGTSLETKKD